ncbi:hypothetical protein UCREL1_7372 [Eutypa lata UCREL1]|uniref:Uncharacterized protein n=1 Tax=Eutypa lata (strain UCR-EL1) TaxID=1287681 RepID=M7SNA5_EUTLA|nr:hypothetical protein UCREL1_7372 [Eutypa lata UCREL1]
MALNHVLSTSSVIVGCNVEDQSSATTTTEACPTSATTCVDNHVITFEVIANDPVPTLITTGALAQSVRYCNFEHCYKYYHASLNAIHSDYIISNHGISDHHTDRYLERQLVPIDYYYF